MTCGVAVGLLLLIHAAMALPGRNARVATSRLDDPEYEEDSPWFEEDEIIEVSCDMMSVPPLSGEEEGETVLSHEENVIKLAIAEASDSVEAHSQSWLDVQCGTGARVHSHEIKETTQMVLEQGSAQWHGTDLTSSTLAGVFPQWQIRKAQQRVHVEGDDSSNIPQSKPEVKVREEWSEVGGGRGAEGYDSAAVY